MDESILYSRLYSNNIIYLRPEVFYSVKFGDETKVGLPCFAFVILEKPKSPPANQRTVTIDNLCVFPHLSCCSLTTCFTRQDAQIIQ